MQHPSVSVIMPVRNEAAHLARSVAGVLAQRYGGDLEIVLAVAPSADGTGRIAADLAAADPRIVVLPNPDGFTPTALNLAIAAARHDIIVRVDAHGELGDGYISTAVRLLEETGAANVGGRMDAQGRTPFEQAVAAAYNSRLGLGGGGFHLEDTQAGPADTVFLGVFRKQVLLELGGFDESLHRAQDWELNYRIRQAGHLVYYSPELRVTYRPRSTMASLARQFFHTGRWRCEVAMRHPDTLSPRYLAAPVAVVGVATGTIAGVVGSAGGPRWLAAGWCAPLGYLVLVVAGSAVTKGLTPTARLLLPGVLAIMHMSWGCGFLAGLCGRRAR